MVTKRATFSTALKISLGLKKISLNQNFLVNRTYICNSLDHLSGTYSTGTTSGQSPCYKFPTLLWGGDKEGSCTLEKETAQQWLAPLEYALLAHLTW